MANTEDIEARLCAYVDGELDEAARAEIERHLGSNPQHRALIDDLIQQRRMLRALPRARAPLDVAEVLNAQLERAALLNDDDDEWHEPMRIGRWPQIRAAAAVLLLVFGLAAVVYYVVPVPGTNTTNGIALNAPTNGRDATISPIADSGVTGEPSTAPSTGAVLTGSGEPDADFIAGVGRSPAFALDALPEPHRIVSNAIAPATEMIADAFRATRARDDTRSSRFASPSSRVKLVLVAADPFAAQQQVEEFLQNHEIRMEKSVAPVPPPLVLDPSQTVYGHRVSQPSRVHVKSSDGKDEVVEIPDIPGIAQPQRAEAGVPNDRPAPTASPVEPTATDTGEAKESEQQQQQQGLETQYVARKLTRRQVDLLQQSLTDPMDGQVMQLVEEIDAGGTTPATQPTFVPVEMALTGISVPALMPWTRQFVLIPATTQPTGMAGMSDERVDVTIVVRSATPAPDAAPQRNENEADPQSQDDRQPQQQQEDQLDPDDSGSISDPDHDASVMEPDLDELTTSPTTAPTSP